MRVLFDWNEELNPIDVAHAAGPRAAMAAV
jgi:hypothetical protein